MSTEYPKSLTFLGILYIALGLLAFFNAFYYDRMYDIFWLCYPGMLLIGLGMVMQKESLIRSQLYIVLFPDIFWTIDFLSYFFLQGHSLFGTTEYFFAVGPWLSKLVTLQHIFTVPLAFVMISKMNIKKDRIWVASIIQVFAVYVITKLFTSREENINCIYQFCGEIVFPDAVYPLIWFALSILMIIFSQALFSIFFKFSNQKYIENLEKP